MKTISPISHDVHLRARGHCGRSLLPAPVTAAPQSAHGATEASATTVYGVWNGVGVYALIPQTGI